MADPSTEILQNAEYETCFTVPPWWGISERLECARVLGEAGSQLICEATASLTYFLSKCKSHALQPQDTFTHCQLEEEITVGCTRCYLDDRHSYGLDTFLCSRTNQLRITDNINLHCCRQQSRASTGEAKVCNSYTRVCRYLEFTSSTCRGEASELSQ